MPDRPAGNPAPAVLPGTRDESRPRSRAATLRALAIGLAAGALTGLPLAALARFEVPLSTSNLPTVLVYLVVVRGLLEQLVPWACVQAAGADARDALVLVAGFAAGVALDPAVHAYWSYQPHRPLIFLATRVLLAVPWAVTPSRTTFLKAGWRGGLLSVLDRETGLATAVQGLLLLVVASDAYRAVVSARMTATKEP